MTCPCCPPVFMSSCPLPLCGSVHVVSSLLYKHGRHSSASESLNLPSLCLEHLRLIVCLACSLTSCWPLLRCAFLREPSLVTLPKVAAYLTSDFHPTPFSVFL